MIREVNKEKRLKWAKENQDMTFEDVIFTDETNVQIETHRRTCCYKRGLKPCYKPKLKHPIKVHVWAGISHRGRSKLCIFEGKMNAPLFVSILTHYTRGFYCARCSSGEINMAVHIEN